MPMRISARHINVHRRLAVRRVTRAMTAPSSGGVGAVMSVSSVAISVVAHALVTWLAMYVPPPALPVAKDDPLVATRFLYPLLRPSPRPVQERVSYVGLLGDGSPTPGSPRKATPGEPDPIRDEVVVVASIEAPPGHPDGVYSEIEVDLAVERDPMSEGPTYPDSLLKAQIEGEARVTFVVDSTGRADPSSYAVLKTNEAAFAEAVRMALPRMKFRPASIGEKRVPQHVEQTFVFKITRAAVVP
jgi:TonB family protein